MYIVLLSTARKNFALDGVATQSSTYELEHPKTAIDGNVNSDITSNSCTHTQREFYPWWKVTLKRGVLISEVVIVNRGDCCGKCLVHVIFPN